MARRNASYIGPSRPSAQGRCQHAQVSDLPCAPGAELPLPRACKWKTEELPEFHPLQHQAVKQCKILASQP